MPTLPLLESPADYRPCIQNLLEDGEEVRTYWLDLFERHLDTLAALPHEGNRLDHHPAWTTFKPTYLDELTAIRRDPTRRGQLSVLELTRFREEQFARLGLVDPFAELKTRENRLAMRMLPAVLKDIDACPAEEKTVRLIRGMFAGNLFDMGSKAAVDAFGDGDFDFLTAREKIAPRPWPIDGLDEWRARRRATTHAQALFFVDNAGPDILLGVLPWIRNMAEQGTRVVLAANSKPSLNDITADELVPLLEECRALDERLDRLIAENRIRVVASGCESPLIDLTDLTPECCAAAAESDLLILEGMGRGIESNYDALFTTDTIKLALIKDPMVAKILGVRLFDPVFRFEPARSVV